VVVAADGQRLLSHSFNSLLSDGEIGLLSDGGASSFDDVLIEGDDPDFQLARPAPDAQPAETATTSDTENSLLQYAVQVLAGESWSEDDESDEFAIKEIPLDTGGEPLA
jgi:hypothetical protein